MAGIALAEGVESANVVGYQEFTIPAGQQMAMFGIMFDAVGGGDMTVQDIFADAVNTFESGASRANADQILYWTGSTYHVLYLNKSTNASRNGFWCNGGTPPSGIGNDWGANNAKCTHVVQPGDAFWINRKTYENTSLTVKMAGQVVVGQNGAKPVSINTGMTLIGTPFTTAFIPNPDKVDASKAKVDWESLGCIGGASRANADQLMFWTGTTYHILYLNKSTNATRNGYWCNGGTPPASTLDWGSNNAPSPVVYTPGGAFWYNRHSSGEAFTLSFTQPYSL